MSLLKLFVNLFHFDRTNWKAVALCLATASIFWLFNALNKTYSANIRFPLEFEFDRERHAIAGPLPDHVLINVNGNGWDLFRKYFGIRVPVLKVPLEHPAETKKMIGSTLPSIVASQIGGIQINFVVQDTLRLQIDNRDSIRFRLLADLSGITYRNGLTRISPVVIFPDSVELTGPSGLLKSISDSIILKLPSLRITNNFREEIEVVIPHKDFIKRNPPVVEVRFEVGETTEVERFVKLKTDSLPAGIVTEEDSVRCSFRVPRKDVVPFSQVRLYALVIPGDIRKREARFYHPLVTGLPDYIQLLRSDSVRVRRH